LTHRWLRWLCISIANNHFSIPIFQSEFRPSMLLPLLARRPKGTHEYTRIDTNEKKKLTTRPHTIFLCSLCSLWLNCLLLGVYSCQFVVVLFGFRISAFGFRIFSRHSPFIRTFSSSFHCPFPAFSMQRISSVPTSVTAACRFTGIRCRGSAASAESVVSIGDSSSNSWL
jgi:hypothetical protein